MTREQPLMPPTGSSALSTAGSWTCTGCQQLGRELMGSRSRRATSVFARPRKEPPFGAVAASMPRSAPAAQICALCVDHCW